MSQIEEFIETKRLMQRLWPKWKADDELGKILNERWGQLHQDKLRDAIRQHRLVRNVTPDVTAIHKEYCAMTGSTTSGYRGQREAARTRTETVTGPTDAEYAEWDAWAASIMATATPDEIETAKERYAVKMDRLLAVAIDHMRRKLA